MPTPDQDGKQAIILCPRKKTEISAPIKNLRNARTVVPIISPLDYQCNQKEELQYRSLAFEIMSTVCASENTSRVTMGPDKDGVPDPGPPNDGGLSQFLVGLGMFFGGWKWLIQNQDEQHQKTQASCRSKLR